MLRFSTLCLIALSTTAIAISSFFLFDATSKNKVDTPVTVSIDAGDFFFTLPQTTFKVGVHYHFVFKNTGQLPHEVMLMPVMAPMQEMDMNGMDKMAMGIVEQENFPPGATGEFDITFRKPYSVGELEFACHMEGHYEGGMHTPIIVKP